jgi:RNA polymerase sigma-70 factor (ECF subfamily)
VYERGGRGALYAELAGAIGGDVPSGERRAAGERLGLSPGALDVALHRLRRRFRAALRAEIAGTVSDPGEVEAELADLFAALGG